MDIDPDISNWILQYLFKQPINDRTINTLLQTLPLPITNPLFLKSLLLLKLQSQISHNSLSDNSIDFLEHLEQIDFQLGNETVSNSMKHAYCALILAKTAKHLPGNDGSKERDKFGFFRNVKRLWRGRVERMQKVLGLNGLGSEELYCWKDDIEAAVWDDCVYDRLVMRVREVDVNEAVSCYVREERAKMGPCFLELVAEKMRDDDSFLVELSNENGVHEEQVQLKDKLIGCERPMELPGTSMGEKLADSDDVQIGQLYRNKVLDSAEVNRVRETLDLSSKELQAVVKDPLPDALRMAEAMSGPARAYNSDDNDPVQENCAESNVFVVGDDGIVQNAQCNSSSDVPRVSLMERNASAHCYEWDETTDEIQENAANCYGIRLPNPRVMRVSPLNIYRPKNLKARRRRRLWSNLEEDTLRTGVQIYGIGHWKDILTAYLNIFEDRTEVDLKDKWRNLTR